MDGRGRYYAREEHNCRYLKFAVHFTFFTHGYLQHPQLTFSSGAIVDAAVQNKLWDQFFTEYQQPRKLGKSTRLFIYLVSKGD